MEQGGQTVETKFNSITPLILQLRNLIFGKIKPDLYTRLAVYLNLVIWFVFFLWYVIGFSAISLREIIFVQKKINVEELIFLRGEKLGFKPYEFLNLLLEYHLLSAICWAAIFVGIALMWRKKKLFIFFIVGSLIFYIAQLFYLMGWNYAMQDTTIFDKILICILATNSLLYLILMPKTIQKEEFTD